MLMRILFKKRFVKQYQKLKKSDQGRVDNALRIFEKNPFDSQLKNHALVGKLIGKRSIAAGFDLRMIFELEGDYIIVIMIGVGTHSQIY